MFLLWVGIFLFFFLKDGGREYCVGFLAFYLLNHGHGCMFSLQLLRVVQEACATPVLDMTGNITEWAGRGTCVLATPVQN